MRVVIDCNVLISAGLKSDTCRRLLTEVISGHQLFVSQGIVDEYYEVASRVKFKPEEINELKIVLSKILRVAIWVEPYFDDPVYLADKDDEIYLATAISAKADVVITGNKRHFPSGEMVKILTPREFLDLLI
ncbi:MAG: putative toxin-antitoxin system toxin component, PIN family [Nitrospirae bacterium]|nr:putative toxin-antitoxin system toxin component, PIN family [Nitrospirota bacterium]